MRSRTSTLARACAFVLIAAPACDTPAPVTVTIPWRMGAGDCESNGLETVRAELSNFGDHTPTASAEAPCAAGKVAVGDVPPGQYSVMVTGLNATCATYGARIADVKVPEHDLSVDSVLLGPKPRPLRLTWRFADRKSCAAHGVVQVEADVQVGDTESTRGAWLCAAGQGVLPQVVEGTTRIVLRGLDADGTTVARVAAGYSEGDLLAEICAPRFETSLVLAGCASAGCP